MNLIKTILPVLGLAVLAAGCKPEVEDITTRKGNIDASHYVAVGDYYTAGYNGGLTRAHQEVSYPAIIAKQLALVGGSSTFEQPLFQGNGSGHLLLKSFDANGFPVVEKATNGLEVQSSLTYTDCLGKTQEHLVFNPYNGSVSNLQNLGIPGLRVSMLDIPGVGNEQNARHSFNYNPYLERLLPDNDSRTYLQLAYESKPTFFTCWFGMSDIYNYALAGGAGPDSCIYWPTRSQNINIFTTNITRLVDTLVANGAKGVIATIPDFITMGFAQFEGRKIQEQLRKTQQNPDLTIWVLDNNSKVARAVNGSDLLLAGALQNLGSTANGTAPYGLSEQNPIKNADYLNNQEISEIKNMVANYNLAIRRFAQLTNKKYVGKVKLVDLKGAVFDNIKAGINRKGVNYSVAPVTGGMFGLDNFSLTPRGQALIANEFINAINREYKARIPLVNPNDYEGNKIP